MAFRFNGAGTTAKEKYSQLNCKKTESSKLSVNKQYIIIPDRAEDFSFPSLFESLKV